MMMSENTRSSSPTPILGQHFQDFGAVRGAGDCQLAESSIDPRLKNRLQARPL